MGGIDFLCETDTLFVITSVQPTCCRFIGTLLYPLLSTHSHETNNKNIKISIIVNNEYLQVLEKWNHVSRCNHAFHHYYSYDFFFLFIFILNALTYFAYYYNLDYMIYS